MCKLKEWVQLKKLCLAVLFALLVPLCCTASEALLRDDLADLEAPLAGLLAADLGAGMAYPAGGEVTGEYAATYLFFMANIFYAEDAQPRPDAPDGFDLYAPIGEDEAALLLRFAFGDAFTLGELEGDGRMLIVEDDVYWLGLADGYLVDVTYAGDEDPPYLEDAAYPYDFTLTYSDGGKLSGRIEVTIGRLDDPDTPLCVTGVTRADAAVADGIAGNWRAADGYWCSLMEEGLIFCFNGRDELVADGGFVIHDGALSVTLNGADVPARLFGAEIILAIDGEERVYERETQ